MCTTNPAFLQHPNGELWLYYKSWCIKDWERNLAEDIWYHTNRQYGLAIAQSLEGPWIRQGEGPMTDLRHVREDPQISFWNWHRYFDEPPNGLDREGRFERPQLLKKGDRPEYLFCAFRGGRCNTSSGVVPKVR